jgi:hypothetical protein
MNLQINVREYGRGNQNRTIQKNWQHRVHKTMEKTHNTVCVGHYYTQTNTNIINKTCVLLQTTGNPLIQHDTKLQVQWYDKRLDNNYSRKNNTIM